MAASITVQLQIFKRSQLLRFSSDFDETGIKIYGLLRYFIYNIVIIGVAAPFKIHVLKRYVCLNVYNRLKYTKYETCAKMKEM